MAGHLLWSISCQNDAESDLLSRKNIFHALSKYLTGLMKIPVFKAPFDRHPTRDCSAMLRLQAVRHRLKAELQIIKM